MHVRVSSYDFQHASSAINDDCRNAVRVRRAPDIFSRETDLDRLKHGKPSVNNSLGDAVADASPERCRCITVSSGHIYMARIEGIAHDCVNVTKVPREYLGPVASVSRAPECWPVHAGYLQVSVFVYD